MSQTTRSRKRAQWQRRMFRFSRSKLSVKEFCRREKISAPCFYQWRRKMAAAPAGSAPPARRPRFLQVQVAAAADVSVVFPNGTRLALPVHDREVLRLCIESVAMAQTHQGGTSC
jgi:hypothetical protein